MLWVGAVALGNRVSERQQGVARREGLMHRSRRCLSGMELMYRRVGPTGGTGNHLASYMPACSSLSFLLAAATPPIYLNLFSRAFPTLQADFAWCQVHRVTGYTVFGDVLFALHGAF